MGAHQMVYCCSSRALCQLEMRVHANGSNPKKQALMCLQLPADSPLDDVMAAGLPAHWKDDTGITQTIGNAWLQNGRALGLWMPSYIEPGEENLLLNPAHPDHARIALALERHPFVFDPGLF